nr:MAG TPA: hypothetical protein [Caudoviricetes sp.]DAY90295.1 MAG TPA: hypothetical protein [Caudoviricetes sp.]
MRKSSVLSFLDLFSPLYYNVFIKTKEVWL